MRAAVWYGKDDNRIEEVPKPTIIGDDVLVKVLACGLCKTDVKKIQGTTLQTKGLLEPPRVFGHEIVGRIEEARSLPIRFKIGDRVVIYHHVPCLQCKDCLRGEYVQCPSYKFFDTESGVGKASGGGFGEYIRVRKHIVERGMIKIPDHITNAQATQVEPLNCCIKAINKADIQLRDRVAIFGCGPIGLTLIKLAKMRGAVVYAIDLVEYRLKRAELYGARRWFNYFLEVDISIVAVESPKAIEEAMEITRGGGTIVFFSEYGGEMETTGMIDLIYSKELIIKGCYSASYSDHELAAHVVFNNDDFSEISHVFPLENLQKAVDLATKRRGSTWEGEEHSEVKESFKIVIEVSKE